LSVVFSVIWPSPLDVVLDHHRLQSTHQLGNPESGQLVGRGKHHDSLIGLLHQDLILLRILSPYINELILYFVKLCEGEDKAATRNRSASRVTVFL